MLRSISIKDTFLCWEDVAVMFPVAVQSGYTVHECMYEDFTVTFMICLSVLFRSDYRAGLLFIFIDRFSMVALTSMLVGCVAGW